MFSYGQRSKCADLLNSYKYYYINSKILQRIFQNKCSLFQATGFHASFLLSQRHIQNHHQHKSNRKSDRSHIGMTALRRLRNQLLHNHVNHRPCCKRQENRQNRFQIAVRGDRRKRPDRLDDTGECSHRKRLFPAHPRLTPKRQGNDRSLREVLNRNSK